jgi:hypothetical protein
VTLTAAGSVDDYTPAVQDAMRSKIATELSTSTDAITLTISSGSVRIAIAVSAADASAAAAVQSDLGTRLADTDSAASFLTTPSLDVSVVDIGTISMTDEDNESVISEMTPGASPPMSSGSDEVATAGPPLILIIAAGGGGAAALLAVLMVLLVCICCRRKAGGQSVAITPAPTSLERKYQGQPMARQGSKETVVTSLSTSDRARPCTLWRA